MSEDLLERAGNAQFAPTKDHESFEQELRRGVGLQHKYDSARLAIGRSLAMSGTPAPPSPADGKSLAGSTLFGKDLDVWLAALLHADRGGDDNAGGGLPGVDEVRTLVHAHWQRGADQLRDDWERCGADAPSLLLSLAGLLPGEEDARSGGIRPAGRAEASTSAGGVASAAVAVQFGPQSVNVDDGRPARSVLNAAGSPHVAIMGKTGSGKTVTGRDVARQIVAQSGAAMLFIDPKGEFVGDDGSLKPPFDRWPTPVEAVAAGETPIPLDFLPPAGAGAVAVNQSATRLRDAVVGACRSAGDTQRMKLLDVIQEVAANGEDAEPGGGRSLRAVRDRYEATLRRDGQTADSVLSRLDEMTRVPVFAPTMPAGQFFEKSWVVSLRHLAGDSNRDLAMLLLLDALARHAASAGESEVRGGVRTLRHLLVVDEARRVLKDGRSEGLTELLREGRSRGQVVMLLSQDPSDFQKQSEDFMGQLGTFVAFACGASPRGMRALKTAYAVDHLMPQELSEDRLPPGVALVKPNNEPHRRVRCFTPRE